MSLHKLGKNILILSDPPENIGDIIGQFSKDGGGILVLCKDIPKGFPVDRMPTNITLVDLRYNDGMNIVRGQHPRLQNVWPSYAGLDTGLARNIVISDVISHDTRIENWKGEPYAPVDLKYGHVLSSEHYRHMHNHYQNLLCEVYNFSDRVNAVAIWGDSAALVPAAKSWGAFFSARSWPDKTLGILPETVKDYNKEDFDAALVGTEIDVLNYGQDDGTISPITGTNLSKIGLQIVGFGKRNTAAIEIRTEDTDDPERAPYIRRGAWRFGIIARNCLHEDSVLFHCENGVARKGLDFTYTTFREGAVDIKTDGEHTGFRFNSGMGGEFYSRQTESGDALNIRLGTGGLNILSQDGKETLVAFDKDNNVRFHPRIIDTLVDAVVERLASKKPE